MNHACTFPACDHPSTTANRSGQSTCALHRLVVVSNWGSWLDDKHHGIEAHG